MLLVKLLESHHRVCNLILLAGYVLVHACDVGIHGDRQAEQPMLFLTFLGIGRYLIGSFCLFLFGCKFRSCGVLVEDCYL